MRKLFLTIITGIFSLVLSFSINAQASEGPLRIGILFAFTGPLAYTGNQSIQGIQIAADMANEKGGINGRKIELVTGDAVNPQAAMSEAERLIKKEGVPLIIGTFSSARAQTASQVAERHKVVYWEMGAAVDSLTKRGFKYFFRPGVKTSSYGGIAADFAAQVVATKLGKNASQLEIVVMHESSLFGTELSKFFMKRAKEQGMNIKKVFKYDYKDRDFSSLIMRLKELKPDIIYDACYMPDFIVFWRQCKELNYSPPVLLSGGTLLEQDLLDALGSDLNGILPCFSAEADVKEEILLPESRTLLGQYHKRMKSKYNITAPSSAAVLSFDAAQLLFNHVLPKVKDLNNSEEIRKVILDLDLPKGTSILGYGIKFAGPDQPEAGQNERIFSVVMQWQNKRLRVVYPKEMATGEPIIPMLNWEEKK